MTRILLRPAVVAGVLLGLLTVADLGPFSPTGPNVWILPLIALAYLVFAVWRHTPVLPQLLGTLAFAAVAVAALILDPTIGQFVVAAGWLAHAGWDYAHRDGTVAPRWYVDFCLPLDVLVAASLILSAAGLGFSAVSIG